MGLMPLGRLPGIQSGKNEVKTNGKRELEEVKAACPVREASMLPHDLGNHQGSLQRLKNTLNSYEQIRKGAYCLN